MADNQVVYPGNVGTPFTVAAKDIGGFKFQQFIACLGDGTVVSDVAPLPVTLAGAVEIAAAQTLGTVTTVSTVTSLSQFNGNAIDTNSGAKSAGTLRVVLATDQPALSTAMPVSLASVPSHAVTNAGAFAVQAAISTAAIDNAGTELTPKFAKIAVGSSGNNAVVTAVTSKKIRVLGYNLMGAGAVNAKFQSDGGGTPVDLTGLKYIAAAGGGICAPFNPVGWFESASGKSLDLNLSGAVAVGGELVYVEV